MKKEISLNRFFVVFLAHTILSLVFTGVLWLCLLLAAVSFHLITPANAVEHSVYAWLGALDAHTVITPEDIPAGADYALFNRDGTLLQTNLEEDTLKTATELAASDKQETIRRNGTYIYLCFDTDTQRVVVTYQLIAQFTSPALQRFFPSAELFFLVLLFLMLIADLIFIAIRYARKLNAELQKLAAAAEQIGQQNLDFAIQKTKLSEFNHVMDSLEHLKEDLKRSLKEQWAMEQQKKRQLAALAHDIKTPLAIITGNAELLLECSQNEEQREYAAFILKHAGQIHRYATGMIELSRANKVPGSTCEIREILSLMAQNVESLGKNKHLSCSLLVENLPESLFVPEDELRRILNNLIDNAVQYSPEDGTVFLCARLSERMLRLSIQDEGEGFSGEALSLAATEFYRSDQSRNSKEHFGLGLAITKQIVTGLGGTLCLENAPEKGALVTVSIPLALTCGSPRSDFDF